MIDPSLLSLLSASIETIVNQALKYDPGTKAKLDSLNGRTLAVEIIDLKLVLHAQVSESVARFSLQASEPESNIECDILLRGKMADLVKLAGSNSHTLANSHVEARGNIGLLQTCQTIFKDIDIDWEDALSQQLGAPLANLILAPMLVVLKAGTSTFKQSFKNSTEQLSEYIRYESGAIVSNEEFKIFKHTVSELRMNTERLEAKIKKLLQNKHALKKANARDQSEKS